jgi:hypothetical protein
MRIYCDICTEDKSKMVEIRLECPNCQSNIRVKMQSEIYIEDEGWGVRAQAALRERLGPAVETIIAIMKDGTKRELQSWTELQTAFGGLEIQRERELTEATIKEYADEQLEQAIKATEGLLERRKENFSILWNKRSQFLSKHLELLNEEKERRAKDKDSTG